jgi:hypothetical protein
MLNTAPIILDVIQAASQSTFLVYSTPLLISGSDKHEKLTLSQCKLALTARIHYLTLFAL